MGPITEMPSRPIHILTSCRIVPLASSGFAIMEMIEAAESLAHMVKHRTWRVSDPSVRLDCTGAAPFLRIHIARISWTG